jgi:hypothetical protein
MINAKSINLCYWLKLQITPCKIKNNSKHLTNSISMNINTNKMMKNLLALMCHHFIL